MGLIQSNKTVSKQQISGEETFQVKLSLQGEPNIRYNPKDIMLLLDKSGSMRGEPLDNLKKGVCHFIDILDSSTDGVVDNIIGNGSKIGIVSFSTNAKIEVALTTSVADLKNAANALVTDGTTNHQDAFIKGMDAFATSRNKDKVMIIFTDGDSSPGKEGFDEANAAKAAGIEIYSIGLDGSGNLNKDALKSWASTPESKYVSITPDQSQIEALFDNLAKTVSEPQATGVKLTDVVTPCFEVVSIDNVTKGTGVIVDKNTVRWDLPSLGDKGLETEYFEFTVKHTGNCTGVIDVNASHTYLDNENNTINLPEPTIKIVGGDIEYIEDCPIAQEITASGCNDYIDFDAGDISLSGLGRVIQVSGKIKNVCPGKQVALAIVVTEMDASGTEYSRGMKTIVIPAHNESSCKDVLVKCIKFVLPEETDMIGSKNSLCNDRRFKVRFISNYIDSDYYCCK